MKKVSLLIASIGLMGLISTANATVINSGQTVIDSGTGLTWLDLSLTANQGLTLNTAAGSYLGEDWRLATNAEVDTLWANFWDPIDSTYSNAGVVNCFGDPECLTGINLWIDYFGQTRTSGPGSNGIYQTLSGAGLMGSYATTPGSEYVVGPSFDTNYDPNLVYGQTGYFLVQDTANVPVPAPLALLCLGLVGLGYVRCRK